MNLVFPSAFLDKLRSLRVHAEFHRHFRRVRKRNVRSERPVTARGRTEQFRRARGQLSAHFRGHAYASGDEHATAKFADRGASKAHLLAFIRDVEAIATAAVPPILFFFSISDVRLCYKRGRLRGVSLYFN